MVGSIPAGPGHHVPFRIGAAVMADVIIVTCSGMSSDTATGEIGRGLVATNETQNKGGLKAEELAQAQMFTEGGDLPLFSGTAVRAEAEGFNPPECEGWQETWAKCRACFDTGRVGEEACVCGSIARQG